MAKERRKDYEKSEDELITKSGDANSYESASNKSDIKKEPAEAEALLDKLNEMLVGMGMLRIRLVRPEDCIGQDVNARYFSADKMNQLVANVKRAGALESLPLVYEDGEKFRIISGHHRVEASKSAGLKLILVLIADPKSDDEIVSKQLSHNELVGQDDKGLLAQLFNSIKDIEWRLSSGLDDAVAKVTYSSLSFKMGTFKEVTMLFLPPDLELYDEQMEALAETTMVKPSQEVRVISAETFKMFAKALQKVKRVENIKNNSTGVMRMIELAMTKLKEMEDEN